MAQLTANYRNEAQQTAKETIRKMGSLQAVVLLRRLQEQRTRLPFPGLAVSESSHAWFRRLKCQRTSCVAVATHQEHLLLYCLDIQPFNSVARTISKNARGQEAWLRLRHLSA